MTPLHKDKLSILAEDEYVLQAIQEIFNVQIEQEKPNIEKLADNNLLGEKYRAYEKAKKILNRALIDIQNYKKYNKINNNDFNKSH